MTYDNELILIETTYTENEIGDLIPVETKITILCDVQSVTRSEHYSAAAHGLKPEIVFVINKFEYGGQKEVEFEGKRYSVDRSYSPKQSKGIDDFETAELICSGIVNKVSV